jgi:hypothetical protein
VARELRRDLVDALGDDQRRTFDRFGEEIPQGAIQAAREQHSFAILRDERERAVDVQHAVWIGREAESRASFGLAHRPESLRLRPDQVDQSRSIRGNRHRVLIAFEGA